MILNLFALNQNILKFKYNIYTPGLGGGALISYTGLNISYHLDKLVQTN